MAREATRAIRFLGLRAYFVALRQQAVKGGAVSKPYHDYFELSPQRMSAEPKQTPQIVGNPRKPTTHLHLSTPPQDRIHVRPRSWSNLCLSMR